MKRLLLIGIVIMISVSAAAVDLFDVINTTVKFTSGAVKASKSLSPVQEYYLGRAVAAQVFLQYPKNNNAALNAYVNKIGQTIVQSSDRPETFGGYHFAVIDSPDINAYACPGGFIFITAAALKAAKTEDEVAAVIAHEVAHVANKHSLKAMKKASWSGVALATVQDVASTYGNDVVREINASFGNTVTDVTHAVLQGGFSRDDEKQADQKGLQYMTAAGYDPQAMVNFFQTMLDQHGSGPKSIFATHAATDTRIKVAQDYIKKNNLTGTTVAARTSRFKLAVR